MSGSLEDGEETEWWKSKLFCVSSSAIKWHRFTQADRIQKMSTTSRIACIQNFMRDKMNMGINIQIDLAGLMLTKMIIKFKKIFS